MEQEKFQILMLDHIARITQQLVLLQDDMETVKGDILGLKEGQLRLENRMTKLEMLIENEVKPKIDVIFEKLSIHDEDILHLKLLR